MLALGVLGAAALTALLFAEAPLVSAWVPLQAGGLLLMLAAVVLAGAALRHGIHAARGEQRVGVAAHEGRQVTLG